MFDVTLALIAGTIVGLAVSIPMGPVGIIVIQRTLARGKIAGFVTGLGSAVADVLTASIAAFGISAIVDFIAREHTTLRMVGGVVLLVFGIISMRSNPLEPEKHDDETLLNKIQYFASGFLLTITNPFTIAAFFLAFSNILPFIGVGDRGSVGLSTTGAIGHGFALPTALVFGILIGTCLWWLLVTHVAEIYEHKITRQKLGLINKWLGGIVIFIAIVILTTSLLVH